MALHCLVRQTIDTNPVSEILPWTLGGLPFRYYGGQLLVLDATSVLAVF